jgi:hypothetical protein
MKNTNSHEKMQVQVRYLADCRIALSSESQHSPGLLFV